MSIALTQGKLKDKEIPKKRGWRWRLFGLFINLFMIMVAVFAVYVLVIFLQMPSLDTVLHETRQPAIIFLDK
ncbi:MAG: hypothetical protein MJ187_03085, partial [Alphaproteobacteria bacterium]|nr:hypothetical protein [Alphaproteobacteria bacterium]